VRAPIEAIKWWEIRRLPFNLGVLLAGVASLAAWGWVNSQMVTDSQDVGEPFLIVVGIPMYAIAANVFYTQGWLTESNGNVRTSEERKATFRKWFVRAMLITAAPGALILMRWALWRAAGV
jgi:hypothetical protein